MAEPSSTPTSAAFPSGAGSAFVIRGGELHCEGVSLAAIAAAHGTPTYVYSQTAIETAYRGFAGALAGVRHRICYSVKANSNLGVLAVLAKLGAGADIVSVGELVRWQKAGGDPAKVVFSGVGKTADEMATALRAGIAAFNVESEEELEQLSVVASKLQITARVAIRVNPDVDAETHPYISTGLSENKFGVARTVARALFTKANALPGLDVGGVDCHIGSQLIKTAPFADAIARLAALIDELVADGIKIRWLDIGGGLGIDYGKGDTLPTLADYGRAVTEALAPLRVRVPDIEIVCEPGRAIVGAAGALLTRVLYRKRNGDKHFTIVDAAMNDLMRPVLYGSHHPMWPATGIGRPTIVTDVVGPICETGDFLAQNRPLPELAAGELLVVGAAGAYGAAMSSNYNTRPRAAEILVSGDTHKLVRRRETLDELLAAELL